MFKLFVILFVLVIAPFAFADNLVPTDNGQIDMTDIVKWKMLNHEHPAGPGLCVITLRYPYDIEIGVVQIFVQRGMIKAYRYVKGNEYFIFNLKATGYIRNPIVLKPEVRKEIFEMFLKYRNGFNA